MLSSLAFYHKYGHPSEKINLVMWDVPVELEVGIIPKKIFCNKDLIKPLENAFRNLIKTGCVHELITYDGCYNFRPIRGYETKYHTLMEENLIEQAVKYLSVHSWACAIDLNASHNPLGLSYGQIKTKGLVPLSEAFLQCFRDAGFDCGGDWEARPDRMHFQLAKLP